MNLKKAILLRAWIAFIMILILAISIVWQIIELQFTQKEKYMAISKERSTKMREIEASRGNIYADDGSLLATSIPKYEIRMDTKVESVTNEFFKEKVDSLAWNLSQAFEDKTQAEWRRYLIEARARKDGYLLIKRDVDYVLAKQMSRWPIFNLGKFKGGFIKIEKNKREIPFGQLAARTIGYTNLSGIKIGLEGAYDSLLTGTSGQRLEQRIYGGVWKPVDDDAALEPHNGFDVFTTIDIHIQDVAENALKQCLIVNNADHGCAILMEVKTGAIKAIANLKKTSDGVYEETDNYAINEFSDPGSTFKLVSALALLEDKYVKLTDTIDIEWGKTTFGPLQMEDAHTSPFKKISFQHVFENSSNVGIAKSVNKFYKNNPEKYLQYATNLGLNKSLPFDIKSSRNPTLQSSKSKGWSGTSLPFMSIGYEMAVSSLQILSVYNAVANNGELVKPYLVKEVKEFGKIIQKNEVIVLNKKICSDETLKQLRILLEGVVENGTASSLKGLPYKVAGKTGTAQIAMNNGFDKSSHKASFVGYFPADNPQYTCMVVINAPSKGDYYGGAVAGPVFKEIADKVFSTRMALHKPISSMAKPIVPKVKNGKREDIKTVLNKLNVPSNQVKGNADGEWVKTGYDVQSINLKELETNKNLVPDVMGMGLRDAIYLLENRGLKVISEGYGAVSSQSIIAGSNIIKGSTIIIKLSNG
ncbi:MAG: transpeptidase family protein [Bacteroidetes bacterium]|nr:transpeptidase family protein [Bacteroidota bacterium]